MGGLRTGCLGQIGNIIRLLFSYYLLVLKRTVFVCGGRISSVASGTLNSLVTADLDFPFLTWSMMSILSLMLNCFLFLEFSGLFIADIFT